MGRGKWRIRERERQIERHRERETERERSKMREDRRTQNEEHCRKLRRLEHKDDTEQREVGKGHRGRVCVCVCVGRRALGGLGTAKSIVPLACE